MTKKYVSGQFSGKLFKRDTLAVDK